MKHMIVAALLMTGAALADETPHYTADSKMEVPVDYRQWVFLTASVDLSYQAGDPGSMHMLDNVFVNPAAYHEFLASGRWPDKTIFVKENRMAESAGTLSKGGRFQTGVMSAEIHVKDEARFPGKWAFFASPDGRKPGDLMPTSASCYSCHQEHGAVDTTFVQFYPTLISVAKAKGTWRDDKAK
jgi:Cytochrome P460